MLAVISIRNESSSVLFHSSNAYVQDVREEISLPSSPRSVLTETHNLLTLGSLAPVWLVQLNTALPPAEADADL